MASDHPWIHEYFGPRAARRRPRIEAAHGAGAPRIPAQAATHKIRQR
jgi:hypothetical protein